MTSANIARNRRETNVWIALVVLILFTFASVPAQAEQTKNPHDSGSSIRIRVPGNSGWVDTGVTLDEREAVTILAEGTVTVAPGRRFPLTDPIHVDPSGTYHFPDSAADKIFPLPSSSRGPAPAYALIGRIGEGEPFFIGRERSWLAQNSGTLQLKINDYSIADNTGDFTVAITRSDILKPVRFVETVLESAEEGRPEQGCSVVVFYVDGLRPDVVQEMAAMGHLPNIRALFLDGGSWLTHNFTAFPSDTITSNGTMWTGQFSDRHGLKSQGRFNRRTLRSESYLEPLGPSRSARLLNPQGIDRFVHQANAATIRTFRGEEMSRQWQAEQVTGTNPLFARLRAAGSDWSTTVLPIMTEAPPLLWTHSMAREMSYFQAHNAWQYLDDANSRFAVQHLLDRKTPVTIVWLPETDSVSHKMGRGQFGMTRRTIARADRLIGAMVDELKVRRKFENTYLLLVSDHGHHGGQSEHLAHWDITNDFLFAPREFNRSGEIVGGGLGLSVRQHRIWNRHSDDGSREFAFVDGNADGVVRVFLPKGSYRSNDWSGPNKPGSLLAYRIDDDLPPVNLLDSITSTTAVAPNGLADRPVDLVLVKLNDNSVLISTFDRGQAIIERKREQGEWQYRYRTVTNVRPNPNGEVEYQVIQYPRVDPLRLLKHFESENLHYFHSERTWLVATAETEYPDGVVALTRHMLWQEEIRDRENNFSPDIVVTAKRGWYFGTEASPGTMHGYPFFDAMRASWFVSGPNVRTGTHVEVPCRLVDLTPTILDMVGVETDEASFDGRPVRSFYKGTNASGIHASQPIYWHNIDLDAWKPLEYRARPSSPFKPISVNHPTEPYDLNNIVYNAVSIGDFNILRLADELLVPVSGGTLSLLGGVEWIDAKVRNANQPWVSEAAQALNSPDVTLSDYSTTSLGNMKRVDGVVDWLQNRGRSAEQALGKPLGVAGAPVSRTTGVAVDATQDGFWELYRFAQRVVVQLVDETLVNGIENTTDRAVNRFRRTPSNIVVEEVP